MARKKSWFERVKRFFVSDSKTKTEKKERRKRWLILRLKSKCSPALTAPPALNAKALKEAEAEQTKHAMAVAVATAAAAEAAVAAAQAAAQVVRLTGNSSYHQRRDIAAINIQSVFRGHLARKALRALKGLVKLQALVRGQAVRRQTSVALKGLQSLMKIQSQACASRLKATEDEVCELKDIVHVRTKESDDLKAILQKNERRWDSSTLSKEEINGIIKSRREATIKRLRAMEYASLYQERRNSQRSTTPVSKEVQGDDLNNRWRWLEEWFGAQPLDKEFPEFHRMPCPDKAGPDQQSDMPGSLICAVQEKVEEAQLRYLARRSFIRSRTTSVRDDDSFSSSPAFPSYMASTASAKARFRSMSTPKQRAGATDLVYDQFTPYSNRMLSPLPSSVASDTTLSKLSKPPLAHLRSPRLKGQPVPVRSHRPSGDFSFQSDYSFLNWDQRGGFR